MKNRFFQIIFFCLSQIAYSQGWVRYFDPIAPSTNVNIKLFCHQGYSASLDGQFFNYKIQNKSNNKLIITFDLVAKTICGTEVTCPIEITLNPLESYGGKVGQIQQIELLNQNVTKANCYLEEDVTYIDNKITKKAKNKISLVYVTHYKETVTIIEKPVKSVGKATKANNEPMSDDEKLNAALMKKMEKDFDEKNKPKNKAVIFKPENNTTANNQKTATSNIKELKHSSFEGIKYAYCYSIVGCYKQEPKLFISEVFVVNEKCTNIKKDNLHRSFHDWANEWFMTEVKKNMTYINSSCSGYAVIEVFDDGGNGVIRKDCYCFAKDITGCFFNDKTIIEEKRSKFISNIQKEGVEVIYINP